MFAVYIARQSPVAQLQRHNNTNIDGHSLLGTQPTTDSHICRQTKCNLAPYTEMIINCEIITFVHMQFACAHLGSAHACIGRLSKQWKIAVCNVFMNNTTRQLTRTSHFVERRSIHLIVSRLVSVIIFIGRLSMRENLNKCRAIASTAYILHCTALRFQVRGFIGSDLRRQ